MKTIAAAVLLVLALVTGYQGRVYSEFDKCLRESEEAIYEKRYGDASAAIDRFRQDRLYEPIKRYARLDLFEIDKTLDYQKGRIAVERGDLKEAFAFFDKCADSKNPDLAFRCLYQQGNVALYMGNSIAEKKWQAALEKNIGGHDFDTQVNLELLKSQKKKAQSAADAAMQTHRRSQDRHFYLRPPSQKDNTVRP